MRVGAWRARVMRLLRGAHRLTLSERWELAGVVRRRGGRRRGKTRARESVVVRRRALRLGHGLVKKNARGATRAIAGAWDGIAEYRRTVNIHRSERRWTLIVNDDRRWWTTTKRTRRRSSRQLGRRQGKRELARQRTAGV